ncbi:helix-turn-helix domain-containing protein [Saccharothrix xinjiangensis]|uniref:Helix-turn-helix domain-containing protein n=1 Tax=Saccharothrix xinjiangensis TaxID=204798 RepID=A0ABV9XVD7_9PSEU
MPNDEELPSSAATPPTSVDRLVAYRPAFGKHLAHLRERSGYSLEQAARSIGVPPETLRLYENATWRPALPRLLRLAALYDVPPLDVLEDVAREVRPPEDPSRPYVVEALLLFCGVAPEQVSAEAGPPVAPEVDDLAAHEDAEDVPLGEALKYRREDDPLRLRGSLRLKREYEAGASIRALSTRHKLAFGTIRTMLVAANTRLRSPGGFHAGGA